MRLPTISVLTAIMLAVALAGGCSKPYSRPITFPETWPALDTTRYISMYVSISGGARPPRAAEQVKASCEDAAVCKALVDPKDTWPRLDVVALKAGSTTVAISYFHPVLKKRFEHRMAVSFVAGAFASLELHKDVPAKGRPVMVSGFPNMPPRLSRYPLRCERVTFGKGMVSGPPKHTIISYSCSSPMEKVSGKAHYIACKGMCPGADFSRQICVEEKGGKVAAMTFYSKEQREGDQVIVNLETRGNPTTGVCIIKGAVTASSHNAPGGSNAPAGPDTAKSDKPSVTDVASGMVVAVEDGKLRGLAKDGKPMWVADVLAKCGKPAVGAASIRHLVIKGGLVQVTYGKHSHANVGLTSGHITCGGSD